MKVIYNILKNYVRLFWGKLLMVDWSAIILTIIKSIKTEDRKVDEKYIIIKPKILSDANYLKGISVLKAAVSFIPAPGIALAAPLLSLGTAGLNIWKRFQLSADFDQLKIPLVNPNTLYLHFSLDSELKNSYSNLLKPENWNESSIEKLERIYNDLNYITESVLLISKYPNLKREYLEKRALENKQSLQKTLMILEQELIKVAPDSKTEQNVREAFESLKIIFPVLNDWSLFNSEGFNEVIDIIDTIV